MAMNTSKVLVGGIAAGIVLNIVDFVTYTYILADQVKSAADAFKPGMADSMMSGNAITVYVITDLIVGLLLVWTYAAIRPRFGPGPRTAMLAALLFWILFAFCNSPTMLMGMVPVRLWWTEMFVMIVGLLLASWIGAKLYTEEGGAAAA